MCFQRKYILQETSDVKLMKKMKMLQGLQYKTENFMILIQHFIILGVHKKPQRCLQREPPVSCYQTGFLQLSDAG